MELKKITNDSTRFSKLLDLSLYWSDSDTTKAFQYLDKARAISGKNPSTLQEGLLYLYEANIVFSHDITRARRLYLNADRLLSTLRTQTSFHYLSRLWNNYGILFQIEDRANEYVRVLTSKVIPYAKFAGDSTAIASGYGNIGLMLSNEKLYEESISYYEKAIRILQSSAAQSSQLLDMYVFAANAAILHDQADKGGSYLDQASLLAERLPESISTASYYKTRGRYYRYKKVYAKAINNVQEAIRQALSLYNNTVARDGYFELFQIYKETGRYQLAKYTLKTANQLESVNLAANRLLHLKEMAEIDYLLGNYKPAYQQLHAYVLEKDSIYMHDQTGKLVELGKKFETVEKENEILKLKADNQQQQIRLDQSRLVVISICAIAIVILIVTFYSWKLAGANRKRLQQAQVLHQREIDSLQQQEEIKLYQAALQATESERNRIARDLHDGLGGLLAGIKMRVHSLTGNMAESKIPAPHREEQAALLRHMDTASSELRRISRDLMPESLLHAGLSEALSDLCNLSSNDVTSVIFQPYDLKARYPEKIQIHTYRIIQEGLQNTLKHAAARNVIVQCADQGDQLILTIEDDGSGYDTHATENKGLGLASITSRVAILKGTLETQSTPGTGTTIHIVLPLS